MSSRSTSNAIVALLILNIRSRSMYTPSKVKDIMKYYHININNLKNEYGNEMRSFGVSVITDMPRGNGRTSDVVADTALKLIDNNRIYAEMLTDIKYLQQRWHRITDEIDAQILQLRISGYSVTDIAEILKMGKRTVYDRIDGIAINICYPHK